MWPHHTPRGVVTANIYDTAAPRGSRAMYKHWAYLHHGPSCQWQQKLLCSITLLNMADASK